MASEVGFVTVQIQFPDNALAGSELDHPVHKQEGGAVRQDFLDY
jgi:hypothetical protein